MRTSATERAEEFLNKAYEVQCDHDVLRDLSSEAIACVKRLHCKLKFVQNHRERKKIERQLESKLKLCRLLSEAIHNHFKLLKDARERKHVCLLCKTCSTLKSAIKGIRNFEIFFLKKFANFRDLCAQIMRNASELKNFRLIYR